MSSFSRNAEPVLLIAGGLPPSSLQDAPGIARQAGMFLASASSAANLLYRNPPRNHEHPE
jgi:hypothetical protein